MSYDKRDYRDYYSSDDDSLEEEIEGDVGVQDQFVINDEWAEELYFDFKTMAYTFAVEFFEYLTPKDILDFCEEFS